MCNCGKPVLTYREQQQARERSMQEQRAVQARPVGPARRTPEQVREQAVKS